MVSSGTIAFRSFAANLLRVRKIEAQIAQESLFNREGFRASLIECQSASKPNLAGVFDLHRMSEAVR